MDKSGVTYKTVTFFFSDIEGSTKLLQKLGDKYSGLLEEQQNILKDEFKIYNGEVLDISGTDSLQFLKTQMMPSNVRPQFK